MDNIVAFLKRAAERTGFNRDVFVEKNIPTTESNVIVMPFFGDMRATFMLSAFLLRPYKELKSKYLILCSWPGMQGAFPYVNEYWSIKDISATNALALAANNFYNTSNFYTTYKRNLITHFENVVTFEEDLKSYYDDDFTKKYWETFKEVKRFLPEIPSTTRLSPDFRTQMSRKSGDKVVIFPALNMRSWQNGGVELIRIPREFWVRVTERIISEGYVPVVYQNWFTYDLSPDFTDRCIYLVTQDVSLVLAAMRWAGKVLDIHSGISRLSLMARCPFVSVDERQRYVAQKDYEIDDLCTYATQQYVFAFSTMVLSGNVNDWSNSFLDSVISKLAKLKDQTNEVSPIESYDAVSFDAIRERKKKRIGVRFIRKY